MRWHSTHTTRTPHTGEVRPYRLLLVGFWLCADPCEHNSACGLRFWALDFGVRVGRRARAPRETHEHGVGNYAADKEKYLPGRARDLHARRGRECREIPAQVHWRLDPWHALASTLGWCASFCASNQYGSQAAARAGACRFRHRLLLGHREDILEASWGPFDGSRVRSRQHAVPNIC